MQIVVNGEHVEVNDAVKTVQELLESKQMAGSPCAVEVNATLIPKRQHAEHVLNEGDCVEIVTLVGGG